MNLFCDLQNLFTESDVEQYFIIPLLTKPHPEGMNISKEYIKTKSTIKEKQLDKGAKQYIYRPDYLVAIRGIPLVVIEAKKPEENVKDGYREACLYATSLNNQYRHNFNPCQIVIATNGKIFQYGFYDSSEPEELTFDDFFIGSKKMTTLLNFINYKSLLKKSDEYFLEIKGKSDFKKPISNIGGRKMQNEEMTSNSFGETLAFDYQTIFTPDKEQDKINVVKNAYVSVKKREQHASPIYKIIKRDIGYANKEIPLLSTDSPNELLNNLTTNKIESIQTKSLILLIGSVGSGKSTFTRHLYENVLSSEIKQRTVWLYIDMNNAKFNSNEIYKWVEEEILKSLISRYSNIDFDDITTKKEIYAEDIKKFQKGLGSILEKNHQEYEKELYKLLSEIDQDLDIKLKRYIDFLCTSKNKSCILMFDNADKSNSNDQILIFDVSQWIRNTFPVLVIMPIRDTTYDLYKNKPPLDTVIKDLSFRIDPPDFLMVLQKRLDYICRIEKADSKQYTINSLDTIKVKINKKEHIEYFKRILDSIRNDDFSRKLLYGLANRNIRKGIEIFLELCRSGHIPKEDFFKIRFIDYKLKPYIFLNALIRSKRKYYFDSISNIKNLFYSDYRDCPPDPFVRLDILKWLNAVANKQKTLNFRHPTIKELTVDLYIVGHDKNVILRELKQLINDSLVIYESQLCDLEENENGQILISICGREHLYLLNNITYLSACSEDIYYKNLQVSSYIAQEMQKQFETKDLRRIIYHKAKAMVDYLEDYKKIFPKDIALDISGSEKRVEFMDLTECHNTINKFLGDFPEILKDDVKFEHVDFIIIKKEDFGLFGKFNGNNNGFIHKSNCSDFQAKKEKEHLVAEIIEYSDKDARYNLREIKML